MMNLPRYSNETDYKKGVFSYFLVNTILLSAIALSYPWNLFWRWGLESQFMFVVSSVQQVFVIWILFFALFRLITFFVKGRIKELLFIMVSSLFMIVSIADRTIYNLFNFHINGLVINLVFSKAGIAALGINSADYMMFTSIVFGVVVIQAILWFTIIKAKAVFELVHVHKRKIYLLFTLLFLTDKFIYIGADAYNNQALIMPTRYVVLYQPTTMKRFFEKYFGFVPPASGIKLGKKQSILHYPKNVEMKEDIKDKKNIVWIVLDGFRFDMLNDEFTPKMKSFASKNWNFKNHYSGGNNTRMGIFTMFYGVHGFYWHDFLVSQKSPFLLEYLSKNGYDFSFYASASLDYPEFKRTVFINFPETVHDNFPGKKVFQRDAMQVEALEKFLDKPHEKPFFSMLFFDSSHSHYSFPRSHMKYKPTSQRNFAALDARADQEKVKNGYKNALYYLDDLFEKVDNMLQEKAPNTILVLTGDHGEEFYEHGSWGHFSSFSKYQTSTPMVIRVPGEGPKVFTHRTTHQDLPATMLSLIGSKIDPAKYSFGLPMGVVTDNRAAVSCRWYECAIIDDGGYLVFGTELHNSSSYRLYSPEYKEYSTDSIPAQMTPHLSKVTKEMGYFYK